MGNNQRVEDCVFIFGQSVRLLENLMTGRPDLFPEIGGHIRHCLDFCESLLCGIDSAAVDYNKRERDLRTESDAEFAIARIKTTISNLEQHLLIDGDQMLSVRHERETDWSKPGAWCKSSIAREFEFMQSHTVHHYAIIALKLEIKGFKVEANFGIADSTIKYQEMSASIAA